jgi:methylmalonyl-CoA epimerase
MKAVLDHIGIAVKDVQAALAFYRDALGLEVEASEDVTSQRVRAHFLPASAQAGGEADVKLELLESTAADSPIAKYLDKRGPGLHHITLRVEDLAAALAQLKSRGVRLIDESPRPGAEGALVAFIHPSSAHGVLVELKQSQVASHTSQATPAQTVVRYAVGDLEVVSLYDGFLHVDGGALFGAAPKSAWKAAWPSDEENRVRIAIRPLLVRGLRTMLIDAGIGDKLDHRISGSAGDEHQPGLDQALADAGVRPEEIDLVVATHLHRGHAGGFTIRDQRGSFRPRFPRARYVVRRGEWDNALKPNDWDRGSYQADDYRPLAEAGVLELVNDDQTIMPGVLVQETGGHTKHHQIAWIESKGHRAVYPGDLVPTTAHLRPDWIAGADLYPVDTMRSKRAFLRSVTDTGTIVLFAHDPEQAAVHVATEDGQPRPLAFTPAHRG